MKYYLGSCRRNHFHRFRWKRLIVVSAGLILAGSGLIKLSRYGVDLIASQHTSEQLRQVYQAASTDPSFSFSTSVAVRNTPVLSAPAAVPTVAPTHASSSVPYLLNVGYPGNPKLQVNSRFNLLQRENKDIIGWLTINKLLDEPVVQRDHVYYLDHDAKGNPNINGTIFLDAGISLKTRPYTYILYGHNMKSGAMFGVLRNYENTTFYHHAPFIDFDIMYENGRYVIFAIGSISTNADESNYVDLYALRSNKPEERIKAIDALINASIYTCNMNVQADDQLLVLVTCVDREDHRRIIAARRIREYEDEKDLAETIKKIRKKK